MKDFKPLTSKKKKEVKVKPIPTNEIKRPDLALSLNIDLNPAYKGHQGTIAEILNSVPDDTKTILGNGKITKLVAGTGSLRIVLDNMIKISLIDVKFARKHKRHLKIKLGKKTIINQYL